MLYPASPSKALLLCFHHPGIYNEIDYQVPGTTYVQIISIHGITIGGIVQHQYTYVVQDLSLKNTRSERMSLSLNILVAELAFQKNFVLGCVFVRAQHS